MFRTVVWARCLLCASLLSSAGCAFVNEIGWLPHHQSFFCHDDPRIGEFEFGCGWLYPWEPVTDEVIIVGEPVTGCLQPSANEIQSDLGDEEVCSRIIPANSVQHAATDLMALKYAGAPAPIIIIGCGSRIEDAVRMCRSLKDVRVTVDRLILVGNTCCEYVPDNVKSCVNIYHSRGGARLTHGKPVFREGNCTEVLNYDLAQYFDTPDVVGLSDSSRELVVYHVRELTGPTGR